MNKKKKHIICFIMIMALILEIMAINKTSYIYKEFESNQQYGESLSGVYQQQFIADTVRSQQRNMLNSLKQSWVKCTSSDSNLILKDSKGHPIYANEINSIGFDSTTMTKVPVLNSYSFNLINKATNEIILEKAQPQWDSARVDEILDMLVAPLKVFGNNGGIIVYDSNSGEVFLDTTPINRLNLENYVSIFDDSLIADNKNKEQTKKIAEQYFALKRDSNNNTKITYLIDEATKMGNEANDFVKYPLGRYNRQFIEMSVLPYETIGFDGQPMQLTILSVANEQDIYSGNTWITEKTDTILNINRDLYGVVSTLLILCIMGTMFAMITVLYLLKNMKMEENGER